MNDISITNPIVRIRGDTSMWDNYYDKVMYKEKQEKLVGEGVGFDRIRRITGYLVGTVERFNNGKRAEERDRVKHSTEGLLDKKAA